MNIIDHLYLQNPWWRDPKFIPRDNLLPKRDILTSFANQITNTKQITSLTGIRRVGKSTIIKQVISSFLTKKINPKHICYFSFDQPLISQTPNILEQIVNEYFNIIGEKIHRFKSQIYVFFDEIQLIPFWQDIIKRYYDINPKIKFVVTGSSSLFINNQSKESLAGRLFELYLPPLTFTEYKRLAKNNDFISYLDCGQFPEMLEFDDLEKKKEYLREGVIGKVLERDIIKTFGLRKTNDFERLFWSLLPNSGQIIQSNKLMFDLGFKKATMFKYLNVLEKTFLINKILNLSGSFRSERRLLRKLYPASTNFLSLIPDKINIGFKVETYVANFLKQQSHRLYLFNYRGREVDFVLPDKKIAIEVKYQEKIRPEDYSFLLNYIKEKKYRGVVVTKNSSFLQKEKNISFVSTEEFEKFVI